MRLLPGTTPSPPDDEGACDAGLSTALASGQPHEIFVTMLSARLLLPVVASPVADGDAEMSVPALVADDGRRALPVFSSYDTLRLWRTDARPVPMPGARVFAGARAEGYDAVVLDVAGPSQHAVEGEDLRALADAAAVVIANPDARITHIR